MTTWILTSAFCKASMLQKCLEHMVHKKIKTPDMKHVIIDQHYPIHKAANRFQIQNLAFQYGCEYLDSGKDLGFQRALNLAVQTYDIKPTDSVIIYDPDDRAETNSLTALEVVMKEDPSLAVLGLSFDILYQKQKENPELFHEERIYNYRVWIHESVEMWLIAAYNMKFIHEIGGFDQVYPYWGGLEAYLYSRWKPKNLRLGYLSAYTAQDIIVDRFNPPLMDPEYVQYKKEVMSEKYTFSFETWLHSHNLSKLIE